MIDLINVNTSSIRPIFKQIGDNIIQGIESGDIQVGDKLPSIHKVCRIFSLSPGTVTKAYEELRQRGIVSSKQGKGYFISSSDTTIKRKILLFFDRLNAYKEILYYSFIENLDAQTVVDVYFHHYDVKRFEKVLLENLGNYTHYIVMPHFYENIVPMLEKVPVHQLYLLDRNVEKLTGNYGAVYQDFRNDVERALYSQLDLLKKYKKIVLVKSGSKFQFIPVEIMEGFQGFGKLGNINTEICDGYHPDMLTKEHCYIVFPDNELIAIIKEIKKRGWKPGEDIGVISYDDTPMKELVFGGISVITTDFRNMGLQMARMVNDGLHKKVANPGTFIKRGSV